MPTFLQSLEVEGHLELFNTWCEHSERFAFAARRGFVDFPGETFIERAHHALVDAVVADLDKAVEFELRLVLPYARPDHDRGIPHLMGLPASLLVEIEVAILLPRTISWRAVEMLRKMKGE